MKSDFDYQAMPVTFVHCLNATCLRGGECLRRQMALRIPPERETVTVVNPFDGQPATGENCRYFLADAPQRYALGITHLLDSLPYAEAVKIRKQLFGRLGRNFYYRCYRKERLVKPSEQALIADIFRSHGISEPPVFDEYVERYNLDTPTGK